MNTDAIKKTKLQTKALDLLINSVYTRVLLYGGGRSGKTFLFCFVILLRAVLYGGSRHLIARKTNNAVWQSIGMETMPILLKLLKIEFGKDYTLDKTSKIYTFLNGSEIWLAGLDDKDRVEKILGKEFCTIYFNEVSQISYQAYQLVFARNAQKIKGLVNKLFFDCNPPSKSHWIYKIFFLGIKPSDKTKLPNSEKYVQMRLNPIDNLENISEDYLESLEELSEKAKNRFRDGKFSDESDGDLWKEKDIERNRVPETFAMQFERIVIGVDPSGDAGNKNDTDNESDNDEIGIVVAGKGIDGQYYVLEDASMNGSPQEWAEQVIYMFYKWDADCIVPESNYGGAMVEAVIRNATDDAKIRIKMVHSSKGKILRAEPVVALYEQGKVHHIGVFDDLEVEMTTFKLGDDSPNRMDSLVFDITELAGGQQIMVQKIIPGLY